MFFSNQENSWEQRNEEEAITDLPNTSFSAIEERLSEEEDETEESLVTTQKDNEAQMELEESSEPIQKDNDVQMISEPSKPIQQTEVEPEEEESVQQNQIEEVEEALEPDQICDETQMESEEFSEDVQANDEEPEEPVEKKLKIQQKASTNRSSTNRASVNRTTNETSTVSASAIRGSTSRASVNRVSTNRTTTNRASTRQTSTVQTSNCGSASRVSKNRASNPTTLANPSNPVETPSPIARMLPNKRHWKWASTSRGSGGNQYFKAIRRGRETINIGDSVLFYSYRKPHEKPYIGKIVSLWLNQKLEMRVRSQWFYRPEELQPPCSLNPPVIFVHII